MYTGIEKNYVNVSGNNEISCGRPMTSSTDVLIPLERHKLQENRNSFHGEEGSRLFESVLYY